MTSEEMRVLKDALVRVLGPAKAAEVVFAVAGEIGKRCGVSTEQHEQEVLKILERRWAKP